MDIRERALKKIRNTDKEELGASLLQKAGVFCWETGLGPVLNALPGVFGQQAVIYFPGRSGKFSFPCYDDGTRILLALTEKELEPVRGLLLQSPGVEIWLKDGWYAGTVRLMPDEEQTAAAGSITNETFFGEAGKNLTGKSLDRLHLLEVTRSAPCTGSSGPGSKSWIWPLAALLLLFSKKKK